MKSNLKKFSYGVISVMLS